MANFVSNYSGAEIDAAIAKATTAMQPEDMQNFQEQLITGSNIKSLNGQSILGAGNLEIQGGLKIKKINSTTWDEDDGPSKADIRDIINNDYDAIELYWSDKGDERSMVALYQGIEKEGSSEITKKFVYIDVHEEQILELYFTYEDNDYEWEARDIDLDEEDQQEYVYDCYPYNTNVSFDDNTFEASFNYSDCYNITEYRYPMIRMSIGGYTYFFHITDIDNDKSTITYYECHLGNKRKVLILGFFNNSNTVTTNMIDLGGSAAGSWSVKQINANSGED